jgi:hypothetical protein
MMKEALKEELITAFWAIVAIGAIMAVAFTYAGYL